MALKIGELLVRQGIVTEGQVEEGLRAQRMFGGRLGTNLVELGFLSEQALAKFLSAQLSLPCIELAEVDFIPEAVTKLIPAAMAEKHKVIPISVEKRKLRLAMSDPTDLKAIDQVSFSTGLSVSPVVAPEMLIIYGLEKYYGVRRATRYIKLSGSADAEFQMQSADQFFSDEKVGAQSSAYNYRQALHDLAAITEHAEIFDIQRKFAAGNFEQVAIFVVRGAAVAGWAQAGCRIADDAFRKMTFAIANSKLFTALNASRVACVTEVYESQLDEWIASSLGLRQARHLLAAPVSVNNQLISVLVACVPRSGELHEFVKTYDELSRKLSFAAQMTYLRRRILE